MGPNYTPSVMEGFDQHYQEPYPDLEDTIEEILICEFEILHGRDLLHDNYIPQDDYFQKELERQQEQQDLSKILQERIP